MSIGTILGFIAGIGLFIGAVLSETDDFSVFISASSATMVVGGALAASFISYEMRYVILALKGIPKVIGSPVVSRNLLKSEVGRVIRWGYAVQKSGLPAIEGDAAKLKKTDPFLSFGIEMVVSGYSGEEIRDILNTTIESSFGRNMVPAKICGKIGGLCPAFGMVGTLVGLVIMLGNLSNPAALGPALSIALITTLYGVLFAQLVFTPVSEKMTQREQIVRFRNYLVAEGLVMLAEKKPPRYIQDRMNSFLDPAIHFNIDKDKQ
ncbi:MAG TPA: flagellar motor protein MotA [Rhodospirillales bacterium]|nr:flagellar motor protein MotA [Rhodospirillales bacterium]HIL76457.1 flagellar motor protein MotA [Rhodospirillales bacterium]